MRIHARPYLIDFQTGEPKEFAVSVVGIAPHKTFFIEEHVALVTDKSQAPIAVGQMIAHAAKEQALKDAVDEHGPQKAQALYMKGSIKVDVPVIPGVTAEGEWVNPKFGKPERLEAFRLKQPQTPSVKA